jgi:hypothetical protein
VPILCNPEHWPTWAASASLVTWVDSNSLLTWADGASLFTWAHRYFPAPRDDPTALPTLLSFASMDLALSLGGTQKNKSSFLTFDLQL